MTARSQIQFLHFAYRTSSGHIIKDMLNEYYQAARHGAAVVEQDWLGVLRIEGQDRAEWLQAMVTNDVLKLSPGQGCYAAHLNAQGRVIAQMAVEVEKDKIWLVLERACVEKLAGALDKLIIMEQVLIQNASDEYALLGVMGPQGAAVLESWLGEPLGLNQVYSHRRFPDCRVARGELGYDVWVPRDFSDKALRAIAGSGALAIDKGTWDVVRTEAGLPIYGVDVDETTTLPELGERGISYEKGCYIGQEVVARIKYIGHVNRKFVGFICESAHLPEIRGVVRFGGKEVGYVTTSLLSPALEKPIALGFVNRVAAAPGTSVEIAGGGET